MSLFATAKSGVEVPVERTPSFSLDDGSLVFIPLLFYAFFCQSLASSSIILYGCLLVSFAAFFLHFLINRRFASKRFGLELVWIPFFALFYIHCLLYGINNSTLFVVYTLLFSCMYVASGERGWVATCLRALVCFAAFHAFCTILFWIAPSLFPPVKAMFFSSSYMARDYRSGFTAHYSTNSIYLSLGLVCWVCGLVGCRGKFRAKDSALSLMFLLALFLTTKRGPLLASIVAIAVSYLFVNRKKFTGTMLKVFVFVGIAVIACGVLAMFVPAIQATLERFVELSEDDTGNGRTYLYDFAWYLFHANPAFGAGWGAYSKYVATTSVGAMYREIGFSAMSAHNVYLQLLAETGTVGLVLFAVPAFITVASSMRRSSSYFESVVYGDSFCLWACLGLQLFFLIYCFSGNPLYDPQCYIPYFISCVSVFAMFGSNEKIVKGEEGSDDYMY